jgi:hypothetical protein
MNNELRKVFFTAYGMMYFEYSMLIFSNVIKLLLNYVLKYLYLLEKQQFSHHEKIYSYSHSVTIRDDFRSKQ